MRRKVNIKLIIIITLISILVIAGLLVFAKTDFFRTKRGAFFRYFNGTTDSLEILTTDKFEAYNARKENGQYTRKADVTIQSSSNIADSNILDKIKLTVEEKTNNKKELSNINMLLKKDGNKLIEVSAIKDKDTYGAFCDEISTAYIGVKNEELKRIATDVGISNVMMIPNELNNVSIKNVIETSKIEKKHINECLKMVKNDVPNNAYSKQNKKKIKINDKSYTTNSYTLSLSSIDNANLQLELLNKISKDSILMDYFASKFKLLNFNEEYTTINSLNDIIKKRINDLQSKPDSAGDLKINVFEFKQKTIRMEIKNGENTIQIDHLKEDNIETSSIKINNKMYMIQYNGTNYTLTYQDTSENGKKIKIDYNQNGNVNDNNIENSMTISLTEGIKNITYSYKDKVEFSDELNDIESFEEKKIAILNDYSDEEIKDFIKSLKEKINSVYISKGASIGINLDPIFEN
ncbi:MAG: hypothetical protein IKG56_01280 [Clostridia bacterium]|nr:hypothetical protein [Clostridia bacterium]